MFTYTGHPLSTLTQISRPLTGDTQRITSTWQWRMHQPTMPFTSDLSAQLHANKWQKVPLNAQMHQSILAMQLYDILRVSPEDSNIVVDIWAHSEDITQIEQAPVILSFGLPQELVGLTTDSIIESIKMLQLLPPPQLGEIGLVPSGDDLHAYHVGQLGDHGQTLWREMSEALRTLASPGDWHAHWELTPLCYDDHSYQTLVDELSAKILHTSGSEQQDARNLMESLAIVRLQAKAVQSSLEKPDWFLRWADIHHMAQALATSYYELHLQQLSVGKLTPVETLPAVMIKPPAKDRRQRQKHTTPTALVTKDNPAVNIRSDQFTQQIVRGLLNSKSYTQYPDRQIAEYRLSFAKDKGQITITIAPGSDENWSAVLKSLNILGDEVIDTFIALLAIAIDTNGANNITMPFYVNPDDILAACQRKRSNGAYTPLQRANVIEHLRTLSHAHVRATLIASYKRRGKPVELRAESAILDVLSGKVGEYETLTGEEIWEKRSIKIGDWAGMVPEMSHQTAIMLRQILKYHSKNERYEKRLGRYLTLQFRVNAQKNSSVVRRSMAVLLEQAGIVPDLKHPAKAREDIESALTRLKRDGVIGRHAPVIDSSPGSEEVQTRIQQQAYHWWDDYSQQIWVIEPPEHIREVYKTIDKEDKHAE